MKVKTTDDEGSLEGKKHFTKIIFDADCIDGGNVNYVLLCLARHYYFPFDVRVCVHVDVWHWARECPFSHEHDISFSFFFVNYRHHHLIRWVCVAFVHASTFFSLSKCSVPFVQDLWRVYNTLLLKMRSCLLHCGTHFMANASFNAIPFVVMNISFVFVCNALQMMRWWVDVYLLFGTWINTLIYFVCLYTLFMKLPRQWTIETQTCVYTLCVCVCVAMMLKVFRSVCVSVCVCIPIEIDADF